MQFAGVKKEEALKGASFNGGFTRCVVYLINHHWNDLLIVYLKSLDLPRKKY